ncbi:11199_t:CDS:1, partial [Paraglomus occultum]
AAINRSAQLLRKNVVNYRVDGLTKDEGDEEALKSVMRYALGRLPTMRREK